MGSAVRIDEDGHVGVAFVQACNRTFFWTATRGEDYGSALRDETSAGVVTSEA